MMITLVPEAGIQGNGWVIASHGILWDVITYPCSKYLFWVPKSSNNVLVNVFINGLGNGLLLIQCQVVTYINAALYQQDL